MPSKATYVGLDRTGRSRPKELVEKLMGREDSRAGDHTEDAVQHPLVFREDRLCLFYG